MTDPENKVALVQLLQPGLRLLEKVDQLNQPKMVFPNIEHEEINQLSQPETVDSKRKEKIDAVGKRDKTEKTSY